MEELKLVGWTYFDCDYPTEKCDAEKMNKMIELIKEDIAENFYVFSGHDHQYADSCTPVFSDGTCFRASMRCWGSIMADVYVRNDGESFTYMDFHMPLANSNFPSGSDVIDVIPAVVSEQSFGCTLKQDRQMIEEALSCGIGFLTTDKVLKKRFEKALEEKNSR